MSDDRTVAESREAAFEDSIATRYNRDYHEAPIANRQSEAFVEFVASQCHEGDRVLDLGCASASLWQHFRNHFPPLEALVGVDLSPKMIEEARRDFSDGDFRVGSMLDIPAETGSFDLVIVSSAFHHIADRYLPDALKEIHRVLDEHGKLIGREPLRSGRVGDAGGWLSGALMNLRHLVYRLTHTREYPEPDPGPDHHAYDALEFVNLLNAVLVVEEVATRHPVSMYLSRAKDPRVAVVAEFLDQAIQHRQGQELYYIASKNYANAEEVKRCVRLSLKEEANISDIGNFLASVEAAAELLEKRLSQRGFK